MSVTKVAISAQGKHVFPCRLQKPGKKPFKIVTSSYFIYTFQQDWFQSARDFGFKKKSRCNSFPWATSIISCPASKSPWPLSPGWYCLSCTMSSNGLVWTPSSWYVIFLHIHPKRRASVLCAPSTRTLKLKSAKYCERAGKKCMLQKISKSFSFVTSLRTEAATTENKVILSVETSIPQAAATVARNIAVLSRLLSRLLLKNGMLEAPHVLAVAAVACHFCPRPEGAGFPGVRMAETSLDHGTKTDPRNSWQLETCHPNAPWCPRPAPQRTWKQAGYGVPRCHCSMNWHQHLGITAPYFGEKKQNVMATHIYTVYIQLLIHINETSTFKPQRHWPLCRATERLVETVAGPSFCWTAAVGLEQRELPIYLVKMTHMKLAFRSGKACKSRASLAKKVSKKGIQLLSWTIYALSMLCWNCSLKTLLKVFCSEMSL